MLQQTVARIKPLVPSDRILIVTGADQAEATRAQLPDLPARNVIAEPSPRDTAPWSSDTPLAHCEVRSAKGVRPKLQSTGCRTR